jgi:hypothetical protein
MMSRVSSGSLSRGILRAEAPGAQMVVGGDVSIFMAGVKKFVYFVFVLPFDVFRNIYILYVDILCEYFM